MTIYKCKGCNKAFPTVRGLSTHFQHKHVCKSLHYGITNQNIDHHDYTLQSKNGNKQKNPAGNMLNSGNYINNSIIEGNLDCKDPNDQSNFDCYTTLESPFVVDNHITDSNISGNMDCTLNNNNQNHMFSYHNDERVESHLLKLMLEINAPNYAYKK